MNLRLLTRLGPEHWENHTDGKWMAHEWIEGPHFSRN
jgi:hypothetical protein